MKEYDPYDSMVPIYIKTDVPKRIKQIGTGVFIDMYNEPFLLTAAHVTDDLKNGELLVPTLHGLSPIEGYMAHIDLPPETPRSKDYTDIAYYRLETNFARTLCHQFWPFPQNRTELIMSAHDISVYSITGYPASKSKKNREGSHTSEIFSYRGVVASDEIYEKYGLDPENNIVVNFSKKRSMKPDTGEMYLPSNPSGASGGAIFGWPNGYELSEDWSLPKLVGIFHTFKEKEGIMIGTPLISIVSAISLGKMKGYGGVT